MLCTQVKPHPRTHISSWEEKLDPGNEVDSTGKLTKPADRSHKQSNCRLLYLPKLRIDMQASMPYPYIFCINGVWRHNLVFKDCAIFRQWMLVSTWCLIREQLGTKEWQVEFSCRLLVWLFKDHPSFIWQPSLNDFVCLIMICSVVLDWIIL